MIQSVRDIYDQGDWMDVSSIGQAYEVQLNQRNGQYRHRQLMSPPAPGQPRLIGEWRTGQPPKEKKNG